MTKFGLLYMYFQFPFPLASSKIFLHHNPDAYTMYIYVYRIKMKLNFLDCMQKEYQKKIKHGITSYNNHKESRKKI